MAFPFVVLPGDVVKPALERGSLSFAGIMRPQPVVTPERKFSSAGANCCIFSNISRCVAAAARGHLKKLYVYWGYRENSQRLVHAAWAISSEYHYPYDVGMTGLLVLASRLVPCCGERRTLCSLRYSVPFLRAFCSDRCQNHQIDINPSQHQRPTQQKWMYGNMALVSV